ncbi:hypothetical protein D0T08_27110 [Emticicia sp. C21]|nr:hypothetical protein D0T08_27110 [Emticicia sp. C21]
MFPVIGDYPINEITKENIRFLLERPLKRKSKIMANRLLSYLKQFFGYAEDEELIMQNPTHRLTKERVGGREPPRKRYLDEKELRLLAGLLPNAGLREEYQAILWLLLATGCRVNEVLRARWEHINLQKRLFYIPADHAKNNEAHEIYLSDFALRQLEVLKETRTTKWLVPNRTSDGPISRQALAKQITDRQEEPSDKNRASNPQALVLPKGR